MNREMKFFIYLIEQYAKAKNTTADKIIKQWDMLNLTDFIYDMYEFYHTEALQNALADIDTLMREKKKIG